MYIVDLSACMSVLCGCWELNLDALQECFQPLSHLSSPPHSWWSVLKLAPQLVFQQIQGFLTWHLLSNLRALTQVAQVPSPDPCVWSHPPHQISVCVPSHCLVWLFHHLLQVPLRPTPPIPPTLFHPDRCPLLPPMPLKCRIVLGWFSTVTLVHTGPECTG